MKAKGKFEEYIKKRISSVSSFLEKLQQEFSVEDFHDLRVEIKKLKAGFALTAFCSEIFNQKKNYKPFKAIFKQAGKVREIQIQESILKKYKLYGSLKVFEPEFKKDYEIESNNFFLLINDMLKEKIEKNEKSIAAVYETVHEKCVDRFLSKQKKDIQTLSKKKNLSASQIHELRKRLKEFAYIRKLFFVKDTESEKIDALQDLLGKWHDYNVISMNLQNAISHKNFPEEETKNIGILEKKISAKTQGYLKKATSDFQTIFSS